MEVEVRGDHITLGQLLKLVGALESGGQARAYLVDAPVLVNGEPEERRGRKLRPGDVVRLSDGREIVLIRAG